MDLQSRIEKYCLDPKHISLAPHVRGFNPKTNEVEFEYDDRKIYVNIDDLEKGYFDESTLTVKKPTEAVSNQNVFMNSPESNNMENENSKIVNEPEENIKPTVEEPTNNITLNDIKTLVELKNTETLDNILKQIAVKNDGTVDMNSIIGIVSNNLIKETTNAINENRLMPTELYKYDKAANLIVKDSPSNVVLYPNVNQNNGFNILKVYIEVAKLYNINYTEEQIKMAKQNFDNSVQKGITPSTLPQTPEQKKEEPANVPNPENMEKAGFADVFILAVIVLVYAAIIVNLIMKLR